MRQPSWDMDRPIRRASSRTRRHVYWTMAALVGVVSIAFALWSGTSLLSFSPAIERDSAWVDTVELGSLVWEVAAAGSLHPANTRIVSAPVAGRIAEKHREVGDDLQPGTPIITLDNLAERRRLLELEQDLRVVQAELSELHSELRSRELEQEKHRQELVFELRDARRHAEAGKALAEGVLPKIEILRLAEKVEALESLLEVERQRADAIARSAAAQTEQQRARVERLHELRNFQQRVVDSLSIRSPATGVLKTLPVETGQWLTEGAVLAEIVEPGELVARLRVPESASSSLRLGLPARLNARGIELTGDVKRIDPAVTAGTITVDVELASAPASLHTDLSVQGFIELDRLDDVVHVARPVGIGQHSEARLQRIRDNGRAESVRVRFGRSAGDRIEVIDGLVAGDQIVLAQNASHDGPNAP